MANILHLAQQLYDANCEDPSILSLLKNEKKALLLGIIAGTNTSDIVAGTKNGASYTARVGYTIDDRLSALGYAITGIETGIRPSNVKRIYF